MTQVMKCEFCGEGPTCSVCRRGMPDEADELAPTIDDAQKVKVVDRQLGKEEVAGWLEAHGLATMASVVRHWER